MRKGGGDGDSGIFLEFRWMSSPLTQHPPPSLAVPYPGPCGEKAGWARLPGSETDELLLYFSSDSFKESPSSPRKLSLVRLDYLYLIKKPVNVLKILLSQNILRVMEINLGRSPWAGGCPVSVRVNAKKRVNGLMRKVLKKIVN